MQEYFTFKNLKGEHIIGKMWLPQIPPVALLQITHGMTEHIGRYQEIAEYLARKGIIVAGFDLPGHGIRGNGSDCASFGTEGWRTTVSDMNLCFQYLQDRFPNIPHFMLGFSLGSFLLKEYMGYYGNNVAGVLFCGSGEQPSIILQILKKMVKGQIKKHGIDNATLFVDKLSFQSYNAKFQNTITDMDWLCSDENAMIAYNNDPLCKKHISSGLFYDLLNSMEKTGNDKWMKRWKGEYPILLLSGEQDPVGNFTKDVLKMQTRFPKERTSLVFCPESRHDIFHDKDKKFVYQTIETFVLENIRN